MAQLMPVLYRMKSVAAGYPGSMRQPGQEKRMSHLLAKYVNDEGRIPEDLLEQLAFNEKMAEIGRLAAGMIHELNTPLSVIVSAAQMIMREEELPEFVREMVERIDQEAQRLSQFTKGLLTFARREDDAGPDADINQVLREVMAFLKYEAQKRSITVVEELDFHLPSVAADGNRLKQVFINLVMNALQAMEQGGTLLVRTAIAQDGSVEAQIADTGPGITPEVLPRIFEPFYSTKAVGEGTGLGLFITRTIVELMGGRITVRSVVGEGTTFTAVFPAA
ncbi:sensor histidine kinase [Geomobilimonas luticola]|nr:HAMP domain-containing sensor histidine kinase [Geomobilimonas luticola]